MSPKSIQYKPHLIFAFPKGAFIEDIHSVNGVTVKRQRTARAAC